MRHLFYILGILAVLHELYVLQKAKRVQEVRASMKNKQFSQMDSTGQAYTVTLLFYGFWKLAGLLSGQWPAFLVMVVVGYLPRPNKFVRLLFAAITLVLLLFVLINHFHLHIHLWPAIRSLF